MLGIGDASGMFPIDSEHNVYDSGMMDTFDILHKEHNLPWRLRDILPQIRLAGEDAGELTDAGALCSSPVRVCLTSSFLSNWTADTQVLLCTCLRAKFALSMAADALRQPGSMAYTPIRTRRRTSG